MKNDVVVYPAIFEHFTDDGEYYVATSPNIKGFVTQGDTIQETILNAQDAIAGWLVDRPLPEVQDPTKWELTDNQQIMWVSVDLQAWRRQNSRKTVRRTVTVPEYLSKWATANNVNVSRATTEKLAELYAE